jgi:pSer/pThr/pTyr-binding forkhead associated (FHA) protein
VRPILEFKELAAAGATTFDAPAVLLLEFRAVQGVAREFRTSTIGADGGAVPPLTRAADDPTTRVAVLEKSGRNPYDGFLFLGRASTCDVIIRDAAISKTHAVIEPSGEGWNLRDNRSRNGTFRNGSRLKEGERVLLTSGDLVTLGSYPLYFLLSVDLLRLLRPASRAARG